VYAVFLRKKNCCRRCRLGPANGINDTMSRVKTNVYLRAKKETLKTSLTISLHNFNLFHAQHNLQVMLDNLAMIMRLLFCYSYCHQNLKIILSLWVLYLMLLQFNDKLGVQFKNTKRHLNVFEWNCSVTNLLVLQKVHTQRLFYS